MRRAAVLAAVLVLLASCGSSGTTETKGKPTSTTSTTAALANPASVYCEKHGGKVESETDVGGGMRGICVLPDGTRVDEWQYYRAHAPQPAGSCSASGLPAELDADSGLSPGAAAMRDDIAKAAVKCDFAALGVLADRGGKAVRYTFGEGNDPVAYWKEQEAASTGVRPLAAMRLLLALPSASQKAPDGATTYVWPAAFATEHPSAAQLEEVAATGLYDLATLQRWVDSGSNYLGYRILITAGGDWTAFVEGD